MTAVAATFNQPPETIPRVGIFWCGVRRGFVTAGGVYSSSFFNILGDTTFIDNTARYEGGKTLELVGMCFVQDISP